MLAAICCSTAMCSVVSILLWHFRMWQCIFRADCYHTQ